MYNTLRYPNLGILHGATSISNNGCSASGATRITRVRPPSSTTASDPARTKSPNWSSVDVPGGAITKGAGSYTVTVKVKSTTYFVAQWRGDADHNGDGSPVTAITVGAKKK